MTALLVPLAFWDFLNSIMAPLYGAVSGMLVVAHTVWAPIFGGDSGVTWVMSIVSLTVVIRTLLIPLFVKQINSARNMQLVQPKIKALQDKYGADREKLGQETMKLYQEEGVNPAASCLPLLLQMPIFIALYTVLNGVSRVKDVSALSGANVGYFFEKRAWVRVALFLSTVPIAIVANGSRVTLTGVMTEVKPELAEGVFHTASGWVILPAFTRLCAYGAVPHISWTRPAIRSTCAGAPPLYGTCVMATLAFILNSSAVRWPELPAPTDAKFTASGCSFAYLTSSPMLLGGKSSLATATMGARATSEIGKKSFSVS